MASNQPGTSKRYFNTEDPKDVEKLLDMLEKGELSDFEAFESDDDVAETSRSDLNILRIGADKLRKNDKEEVIIEDDFEPSMPNEENDSERETVGEIGTENNFPVTEKKNIKWRKHITPDYPNFVFENKVSNVLSPLSPISYFEEYISNQILEQFAEMTNIYAEQQMTVNFKHTTPEEIKTLIGLHILMGNMQLPRIRMYWEPAFGINRFAENMTRNRFFQLRRHLHLINNLEIPKDNKDKMIKVRPIYEAIRNKCLQLTVEENICVDEQIVPFKGKIAVKQYIRGKPNPWGIKIVFLCGKGGLAYNFLIYQGATTELDSSYVQFGQGAAVVLHLMKRVETPGHSLFCDNFFTTYHLLQILSLRNIYAAGTARQNRFANPPFISDKELAKKGRGSSEQLTSTDGIILVKWTDNKSVTVASIYMGIGNISEVERWDKNKKKYIKIQRPEIIKKYNEAVSTNLTK